MTSYQSKSAIRKRLQEMIPQQVQECRECDELPLTLEQVILHNFQAKFVCYNKQKGTIEVGVEEQEANEAYPVIKTHSFRLEEAVSYLGKTFRSEDFDLKFYAKVIAQEGSSKAIDEVVLV